LIHMSSLNKRSLRKARGQIEPKLKAHLLQRWLNRLKLTRQSINKKYSKEYLKPSTIEEDSKLMPNVFTTAELYLVS
jgi:very-short-patch-repair endonuclease